MDHVGAKAEGIGPDLGPVPSGSTAGKCIYLPRFDARESEGHIEARGYGARIYASPALGGKSYFTAVADAEMYPRASNRLTLSDRRDAWGIPVLRIDVTYSDMERDVAQRSAAALQELSDLLGVRLNEPVRWQGVPGNSIHEVPHAWGAIPRHPCLIRTTRPGTCQASM
ncbi:MAG: hypothetical protein ACKO1N_06260 [Erythrobacter sp.]